MCLNTTLVRAGIDAIYQDVSVQKLMKVGTMKLDKTPGKGTTKIGLDELMTGLSKLALLPPASLLSFLPALAALCEVVRRLYVSLARDLNCLVVVCHKIEQGISAESPCKRRSSESGVRPTLNPRPSSSGRSSVGRSSVLPVERLPDQNTSVSMDDLLQQLSREVSLTVAREERSSISTGFNAVKTLKSLKGKRPSLAVGSPQYDDDTLMQDDDGAFGEHEIPDWNLTGNITSNSVVISGLDSELNSSALSVSPVSAVAPAAKKSRSAAKPVNLMSGLTYLPGPPRRLPIQIPSLDTELNRFYSSGAWMRTNPEVNEYVTSILFPWIHTADTELLQTDTNSMRIGTDSMRIGADGLRFGSAKKSATKSSLSRASRPSTASTSVETRPSTSGRDSEMEYDGDGSWDADMLDGGQDQYSSGRYRGTYGMFSGNSSAASVCFADAARGLSRAAASRFFMLVLSRSPSCVVEASTAFENSNFALRNSSVMLLHS